MSGIEQYTAESAAEFNASSSRILGLPSADHVANSQQIYTWLGLARGRLSPSVLEALMSRVTLRGDQSYSIAIPVSGLALAT